MDFGPSTQQFDTVISFDALPEGTRLGGYQIIEILGRGGFGIVYLALDSSLQRQVAIKEYLPAELAMRCQDGQVWVKPGVDPAAYSAGMTAFLSEAKMLARFDHPSLARVHTFWEENRTAYMVMPYYDGRTLGELLAEMKRPPDETWLRSLLVPLLSALSTLHNAQCLHMDISPDNIIVQGDGRPVLLDFGVASRIATDKTMPLTALLNPAYAPIEQYSESPTLPQGPWTDLYALASVLHFAIAGRPPARATVRAIDDPQRPLAQVVAERAQHFPGLSYDAGFLSAIDKALAVKPRDRPRSAAEFQMLLDQHLRGGAQPVAEPPPTDVPLFADMPPTRAPEAEPAPARDAWMAAEPTLAPLKPRRSRTPLWIASVSAVALLAVGGWAWLQRQPALATITAADLPPAVVAAIPKVPPTGAGAAPNIPAPQAPEGMATSAAAPTALTASTAMPQSASAPTVATASPAPASAPGAAASAAAPAVNLAQAPAPSSSPVSSPPVSASKAQVAPPAPAAPAPRTAQVKERSRPAARPAPAATVAAAPQATAGEPNNPRAICGTRTNFALLYCMEQQCKRAKFVAHPQCVVMKNSDGL